MDRESATETVGKRFVTTSKIEFSNDIDDADISVRAGPACDEVEWVVLQEVS